MKFLLLKHRFRFPLAVLETLGLEMVAAALHANNIDFVYHDENFHSGFFRFARIKKIIKKNKITHLGITTNPNDTDQTLNLSRKLKKNFPGLYILIGGNNAELNYNIYYNDAIDLIYHDNGLKTFDYLVKNSFHKDAVENAKGVCYKKNGKWISNEKSAPVNAFEFEPLRLTDYKKTFIISKGHYALIKSSWSCPYKCSFCYCRKMNNGVYTERELNTFIDEISRINNDKIWIVDDCFFVDKKRVQDFCNAVIEKKLNKTFIAYSRADFIAANRDILPLIRQAGFKDIMVGLEAVDDRILKDLNKLSTKDINAACVKALHENNIECIASFITTPEFTRDDFKNLKAFIKQNHLYYYMISPLAPFINTDTYEKNKELYKFKFKRLNGIAINFKPLHMSKFEYFIRLRMFYVRLFGKLLFKRKK